MLRRLSSGQKQLKLYKPQEPGRTGVGVCCRQHGSGCRGLKQWPIPGSAKRSLLTSCRQSDGQGLASGRIGELGM